MEVTCHCGILFTGDDAEKLVADVQEHARVMHGEGGGQS